MVEQHILALDWDSRHIRVVQAAVRKGRYRIEHVMKVAIPPDVDVTDPESLGSTIHKALLQEGITCRHAVVNLPRDQVVLNTMDLPKVSWSDTSGMVGYQIGRLLPFPVEDAVIDFALPQGDAEGETRPVLVGAVRQEVFETYKAICEHAGLRLERLGLRPVANAMSVQSLVKDATPQRVLFIDVGPAITEIDVLVEGRLAFSRAASLPIPKSIIEEPPIARIGEDESESSEPSRGVMLDLEASVLDTPVMTMSATALVNALLVEVTRSIEAYRITEPGAGMDHVVVGGTSGLEEELAEAIRKRFSTSAEVFNPALVFGLEGANTEGAGAFGAAFGSILNHITDCAFHFDFLHPKRPISEARARLKRTPLVAAAAVLFIAAGGVLWWKVVHPKQAVLRAMNDDIAAMQARLSEQRDFVKVMKAIQEFESDRVVWVNELKHLIKSMPDNQEVVIDRLDMYQKNASMDLQIRFKEREQAEAIRQKLLAARPNDEPDPYFGVDLGRQSESEKGTYRHDVKLTVTLREEDTDTKKR